MDRMIHTAFNSLKNIYDQRFRTSNNLANVNVPGFRRDLPDESGSRNLSFEGQLSARQFALESGISSFSKAQGTISESGVDTDVSVVGDGYMLVKPIDGEIALSRRGDLSLSAEGILQDGASNAILSRELEQITVPAYREIQFSETGEVLVDALSTPSGKFVSLGYIGTANPDSKTLFKDLDGQIRVMDRLVPALDQKVKLVQGMLEAANVNSVEELVSSMELQRQFEISIKFISLSQELDEGGSQLMRMPQG
ncbi:MAG: flagellar basal body rod C-terminal domain-containing protein [Paracoccaceae bacterium]|jgi:flagellar basal-body rod protein FlgF